MSRFRRRAVVSSLVLLLQAGGPGCFAGVYYDRASGGNWNSTNTWETPDQGGAGQPAGPPVAGDTGVLDQSTVQVKAPAGVSWMNGCAARVLTNATLSASDDYIANYLTGGRIELAGGRLYWFSRNESALGGSVDVCGDSTLHGDIDMYRNNTLTLDSLRFVAPSRLVLRGNPAWPQSLRMNRFGSVDLAADSEIHLADGAGGLNVGGIRGGAGRRLTVTASSTALLTPLVFTGAPGTNFQGEVVIADNAKLMPRVGAFAANDGGALRQTDFGQGRLVVAGRGYLWMPGGHYGGALTGLDVHLRGGTVFINSHDPNAVGGNIVVEGDSVLHLDSHQNRTATDTFEQLEFAVAGATFTVEGDNSEYRTRFVPAPSDAGAFANDMAAAFASAVTPVNGTLRCRHSDTVRGLGRGDVRITVLYAFGTLTHMGSGSLLIGSVTVRLPGSAALLASDTLTLVDSTGATGAFDKGAFSDPAKLWNAGGTNRILTAALRSDRRQATVSVERSASFAGTDAGHVAVTGLTQGRVYRFGIGFESFDPGRNIDTVQARMRANPAFRAFKVMNPAMLTFECTAPVAGVAHFAWGSDVGLGGKVNRFGGFSPPGTQIVVD